MHPRIYWGSLLRSLREAHGLLQKELAVPLEVPRQTISAWENGRCKPYPEMIFLLSYIYEVDLMNYVRNCYPKEILDELRDFRSEAKRKRILEKRILDKEVEIAMTKTQTQRSRRVPAPVLYPDPEVDPLELLLKNPQEAETPKEAEKPKKAGRPRKTEKVTAEKPKKTAELKENELLKDISADKKSFAQMVAETSQYGKK